MSDASHARPSLLALAALLGAALAAGLGCLALAWWALADDLGTDAPVGASSAPAAEADGWAPWDRNADGTPVRWNPCSPIELVVNPRGAYPGFAADLAEAIRVIEGASGLDLEVVDEVDERPHARRAAYQPERYGERWAPVLVAFAAPGEGDLPLLEVDRALAAPVAVGPTGDRTYVTGQVVLNAQRGDLRAGSRDQAYSWGSTLRHELGHLVGLDHVADSDQLMARYPGQGPVRLGEGDREGLRALGTGGCIDPPAARHVEVELDEVR